MKLIQHSDSKGLELSISAIVSEVLHACPVYVFPYMFSVYVY